MALWKVNDNIVYSDGALTLDPDEANGAQVTRYTYKVPYSNIGKGGIVKTASGTFHTPSWTQVHEQTTIDDIIVEHRPFDELFTSEEQSRAHYEPRKFASTSSDKTYTVRLGRNGFYCDCWGYLGHKKCKHVKQAQEEWDMS